MNSARVGKRRRGGYTLIEMAAVVSATSAVLLVSVLTLKLATDAEKGNRGRANEVRALSTAAETFRADVQAAEHFEADKDTPGAWKLTLGDGRVAAYSVSQERLLRREIRGETIVSTREFDLPRKAAVTVAEDSFEGETLLRLQIEGPKTARCGMTIVAILGRDRRFAGEREKP